MANNNIRLDIEVRNKGLLEAIKSTNTLEKNMKTLSDAYGRGASSYQRYYRAVRKLAGDDRERTKQLLNHGKALRAEAAALSKAKKEAKEYARARREAEEANRAFDQQVRAYENLRRATDANYASTQRFKEAKRVLRAELAAGRITQQQYLDQLLQVRRAMNETAGAAGQMGRRISRNGVLMQQTGYQVGDFIVQIQSGTNAFVAAGQQLTQMAGTLTLLGGKFIALGTVLGIAIPLFTAAAAAIMRTREEAEDTAKEFDTLSSSISSLEKVTDGLVRENREVIESYRSLIDVIEEVKTETLKDSLQGILDPYEDEIRSFERKMSMFLRQGGTPGSFFNPGPSIDLFGLQDFDRVVQVYQILNDISGDTREELSESVNAAYMWLRGSGLLTKEVKVLLSQYAESVGLIQEATRETEEGAEKVNSYILESAEMFRKAQQRIRQENGQTMQDRLDSEAETAKRIEDERLQRASETADAERLIGEQLQESMRQQALETHRAEQDAIAQTSEYIKEMVVVFNAAQQRMRDEEIAETEAALDRLFRARTVSYRIRFAGDASVMGQAVAPSGGLMNPGMTRQELLDSGVSEANLSNFIIKPDPKGSGAGGSKSDPVARLREQLELERELVGVSEDRERVLRALGLDFVQKNPEIAEGLQEQIAKTRELIEAEKERQSILQTVETSLENGLMSMVEGTKSVKDAFKDMARSIIKELYDVLVVQQMVGSFDKSNPSKSSGILGFAGKLLTGIFGKASGGTVQANQPYLVGEKGPELIVPRNRGHVMNADLTANAMGRGETVVVNQSFNFQANGDESVKKIIAQAAPSIANMAKQSVMDARRRGGAMKNTFG